MKIFERGQLGFHSFKKQLKFSFIKKREKEEMHLVDTDVIIIGGGVGGYIAALKGAQKVIFFHNMLDIHKFIIL